jgi:hypothetical protein
LIVIGESLTATTTLDTADAVLTGVVAWFTGS